MEPWGKASWRREHLRKEWKLTRGSRGRARQAERTMYMKLLSWTRVWLIRGTENRQVLWEHRYQREVVGSEVAKAMTEGHCCENHRMVKVILTGERAVRPHSPPKQQLRPPLLLVCHTRLLRYFRKHFCGISYWLSGYWSNILAHWFVWLWWQSTLMPTSYKLISSPSFTYRLKTY